jgi:hypothetical protein
VSSCENFDVFFYDDVDGDAVSGDATVIIRNCPTPTADTDGCWAIENLTLNGDPAVNTEAIYGAAGTWIFVEVVTYATLTEPIRVIVRCNGPAN